MGSSIGVRQVLRRALRVAGPNFGRKNSRCLRRGYFSNKDDGLVLLVGKNFAGVHNAFGVQRAFDALHDRQRDRIFDPRPCAKFGQADAVFGGK